MASLTTKERILLAAVQLFSDVGFDNVSMRDIAKIAGIQAPSIYNHFESKQQLLSSIYEYFTKNQAAAIPDVAELLEKAATSPVADIISRLEYQYPPAIEETMGRILLIACQRLAIDRRSEQFIFDRFFSVTDGLYRPVLSRLVELGRIQPLDIDAFIRLVTFHSYSMAVLSYSQLCDDPQGCRDSQRLMHSLIQTVPD